MELDAGTDGIERIQTRIGVRMPIVEMFSNDPRLADLAAWTPEKA